MHRKSSIVIVREREESYPLVHTYVRLRLQHLLQSGESDHGIADVRPLSWSMLSCGSRGLGGGVCTRGQRRC